MGKYKDFYENHIKLLANNDADALVENDYHDDAVMILLVEQEPIYVVGKEALKKQLGMYLQYIYRGFVSTEKFAETEDSLFFEATIMTANGEAKVYDALYMKDGKIYRHFSGVRN